MLVDGSFFSLDKASSAISSRASNLINRSLSGMDLFHPALGKKANKHISRNVKPFLYESGILEQVCLTSDLLWQSTDFRGIILHHTVCSQV